MSELEDIALTPLTDATTKPKLIDEILRK